MVVVQSVRLPERSWLPWVTRFAEHLWVDVRVAGQWHRVEWNGHLEEVWVEPFEAGHALQDQRWEMGVAVHSWYRGAVARQLGRTILKRARDFPWAGEYRIWPGPNSNSFVDWLSQEVPGFATQLPPNALGKDYTPWFSAGISRSRSGVHLDTLLFGTQLGLKEGVEAHVLGFTLGVGLWPPQLKLPFLPAIPAGWFAPW